MSRSLIHHEKYRDEFSMTVAVACNISRDSITILYHDISLDRSVARSVAVNADINTENVCVELSKFIFHSMREYGIPSSAVKKIGCAAPMDISDVLEDALDPTDMFLSPDTEIAVLPFLSMYADGRYTAGLIPVLDKDDIVIADIGRTLNLSYKKDKSFITLSVPLAGAFDGSGIESGVPCEFGAIDEVHREADRMLCYSVIGDSDSVGIGAPAVLDAVSVMLSEGIIDPDGIMTDRDLFYIGEDYYISQKDVRAVQSDKAKVSSALECFFKRTGDVAEIFFTGEIFAGSGMKRLSELGVISESIANRVKFARSTAEQGIISYICDEQSQSKILDLICSAEDITATVIGDIEDLYITNLSF